MTIPPRAWRDDEFQAVKGKLIKKSNLYEFNRVAINLGAALGAVLVLHVIRELIGPSEIDLSAGSPAATVVLNVLSVILATFLLQRFLLPDRVALWLRPFVLDDSQSQFNIALPIYTSLVPFARVVALARYRDQSGDAWAVTDKHSKSFDAAQKLVSRIHKKTTRLKTGTLIRCPDVEWKHIISYWLNASGIVIIDASNIGPGLTWEIGQVCESFGPDSVIFCLAESDSRCSQCGKTLLPHERSDSADPLLDNLTNVLGEWYPQQRRIIRYPRFAADRETCEVTGKLLTHISECLASEQFSSPRSQLGKIFKERSRI